MIPLLSDDRERGKPRITLKKKPQTRRWTPY
jgi:hypothetical protein